MEKSRPPVLRVVLTFEKQMTGEGFTFVEVLAACPTNWGMETLEANKWLMENMAVYYPLGVVKEVQ